MEIRHKRTGEIVKVLAFVMYGDQHCFMTYNSGDGAKAATYNSFDDLMKDWEGVKEEPKWDFFTADQKALIKKFMEVNRVSSDVEVEIGIDSNTRYFMLYFGEDSLELDLIGKIPRGLVGYAKYTLAELGLEDLLCDD